MKTSFFTIFILIISLFASAQKSFKKGYIIDNNGQRIECLIGQRAWLNSPESFVYKTSDNQVHKAGPSDARAFGVYGDVKYESHYVDFRNTVADIGQGEVNGRTRGRVFLRVEVDGAPSLLYYESGAIKKFFYQNPSDSLPVPMQVEARAENGLIDYNVNYKNQLNLLAQGCKVFRDSLDKLKYNARDIGNTIVKINECKKTAYTDYRFRSARVLQMNLTLTAGLNTSQAKMTQNFNAFNGLFNTSMGSKPSFTFGAELDFHSPLVLPGLHLLLAPSYQSYSDEKQLDEDYGAKATLKHLDIALGLRYFLLRQEKLGIFVDGFYVPFSLQFKSEISVLGHYSVSRTPYTFFSDDDISTASSIAFGAGAEYGRLGFSARYYLPHKVVQSDTYSLQAKYSRVSALIRFRLF